MLLASSHCFSCGQGFLGTGTIMELFHISGTVHVSKDSWTRQCHAGVSSSAHVFSIIESMQKVI